MRILLLFNKGNPGLLRSLFQTLSPSLSHSSTRQMGFDGVNVLALNSSPLDLLEMRCITSFSALFT